MRSHRRVFSESAFFQALQQISCNPMAQREYRVAREVAARASHVRPGVMVRMPPGMRPKFVFAELRFSCNAQPKMRKVRELFVPAQAAYPPRGVSQPGSINTKSACSRSDRRLTIGAHPTPETDREFL
jgi:hypothetical protein